MLYYLQQPAVLTLDILS